MMLEDWARDWSVPPAALIDLRIRMTQEYTAAHAPSRGDAERDAQAQVMLEAGRKGILLWRNNVGALKDEETNRLVRYGLANSSAGENKLLKSGDLIGMRPVLVTPAHVGRTLGVFVSREIKKPGWVYRGTGREPAQLTWAQLILANGGDAAFTTGEGSL